MYYPRHPPIIVVYFGYKEEYNYLYIIIIIFHTDKFSSYLIIGIASYKHSKRIKYV